MGVIILAVLTIASIFAFVSPYDPSKMSIPDRLQEPSMSHPFGTDDYGRDYLTRALYGGRVSLAVGFLAMVVSVTIGTAVGTISGYFGGKLDNFLMRVVEVLMSIPSFFNAVIKCLFKTGDYDVSSYYWITNMDGHRSYRKSRDFICKRA